MRISERETEASASQSLQLSGELFYNSRTISGQIRGLADIRVQIIEERRVVFRHGRFLASLCVRWMLRHVVNFVFSGAVDTSIVEPVCPRARLSLEERGGQISRHPSRLF